jgi:hypothetical protein
MMSRDSCTPRGKKAYLLAVSKDGSVARPRRLRRAEVLAAAKSECEARGWPWREPVHVTGWLFRFRVWTNANFLDDNPWFVFTRDGPGAGGMGSSPVTSVAPPETTPAAA